MNSEFAEGVEQFNRGEYFAAHETWERLWLEAGGQKKLFLQGTIQLAAAFHHLGRGNTRGARTLLRAGRAKLEQISPVFWGIRVDRLRSETAIWSEALEREYDALPGTRPQIEWADEEAGAESA